MVYKLVEVDGIAVEKRSTNKASRGGAKKALRVVRPTGTIVEEVIYPAGSPSPVSEADGATELLIPLVREGKVVDSAPTLEESRAVLKAGS